VNEILDTLAALKKDERLGALITVVDGPDMGAVVVLDRETGLITGDGSPWIGEDIVSDANGLMDREESRTLQYGDRRVFIDTIAPSPVMLIFGAGHIAQPLSRFAHDLGFRVVVADARSTWATTERFPDVDELIVAWPDSVFDHVVPDSRTYVVLLSHDSRFEIPVFRALRDTRVRYLGAMGSRRTHALRVARLVEEGWTQEATDAIHGPIGLDLKAKSPAETAIAILAEVVQVRYGGGSAVSLNGTDAAIHSSSGST